MRPLIIKNVLSEMHYSELINNLPNAELGLYDWTRSRYMTETETTTKYAKLLEPIAQEIFKLDNLIKSYSLFCKYFGNASLEMHKDDNACTYTIDLCVRQTEPWGLWVENIEYILQPNEALCYLGNEQIHGRIPKQFGENGFVEMMFFHYVTPDHWFFNK
jgi:hypothetical protein